MATRVDVEVLGADDNKTAISAPLYGYEFVITFATIIVAAAVFFFLVPSNVSVGSISGLAIVLSNFVPLPVSAITMFLNVGLLIIGFLLVGREFGVKTVYTSILLPAVMWVFEVIFPNYQSMTGDQTLDVIGYIVFVSFGLAMLFNRNASSGGLDIVAKLLNKFFHMELGKAMSFAGILSLIGTLFLSMQTFGYWIEDEIGWKFMRPDGSYIVDTGVYDLNRLKSYLTPLVKMIDGKLTVVKGRYEVLRKMLTGKIDEDFRVIKKEA